MFIGQYRHSLDAKNRLIIPAQFRDGLGESFVLTKGLDGCLSAYTAQQFNSMVEELTKLPLTKKEARQFLRTLTTNAVVGDLDKQGRLQLPAIMVTKNGFVKNCVITGVSDHVEIWPEERWEAYDEEAAGSFETIAESLTEYLQ